MEYCFPIPGARRSFFSRALGLFFRAAPTVPLFRAAEDTNTRAERIMDTYGNMILRYAYAYMHSLSDAEEVLQDTLIQFLRTAPAFESPAHEKAWLLRVTANLSKNRLGYNRRRQTDELNDELIGEEREDLSFVWEAVKSLPPGQREAIHLFYYEDYSVREIAGILRITEANVKVRLSRGRRRLKEALQEVWDDEQ